MNKLIHGVGTYNTDCPTWQKTNEGQIRCPYYQKWMNMLARAYSDKYRTSHPTYEGVEVDKKWHLFTNFKQWMQKQEWEGKELDKDILYPNNRIYSAETCIFISQELNRLMTNNKKRRGKYPQGVSLQKSNKKYLAYLSIDGKNKYLGGFETIQEAEQAYIEAKIIEIERQKTKQTDYRIIKGLNRHIGILRLTN